MDLQGLKQAQKKRTFLITLLLVGAAIAMGSVWLYGRGFSPATTSMAPHLSIAAASSSPRSSPSAQVETSTGVGTCPKSDVKWKTYTAPDGDYVIQYPSTASPQMSPDKLPGMVSRMILDFEQPFQTADSGGSIRFSVQVSVWMNPDKLTAETWARQNTNPQLVSEGHRQKVGGLEGYVLRESNLTAREVHLYAAQNNRMYEVQYMDVATDNTLITDATAACWKAVLQKIMNSFSLSALAHVLNRRATIEPDKGLFLKETWRLHPDICAFTSELFYDGRLAARPENQNQRLNTNGPLDGTGLRYIPVPHSGNQSESLEEVAKVRDLATNLLASGATWTDKTGV
jgi:hypothetical protein